MFKTPPFWYSESLISKVLTSCFSPLAWLYYFISCLYQKTRKTYKPKVPVVCIGNFTVGGSGKTPSVIAFATLLKEKGEIPHIITRGYGTINKEPIKVDLLYHTFEDVGDEALILAKYAPTWVCIDRRKAAKQAEEMGATVILMDDGFQNESIQKTLSFIVVDGLQRFGNKCLFPFGPLRTPLKSGIKNADAFLYLNASNPNEIDQTILSSQKAIFTGKFFSKEKPSAPKNIVAFAGLGYPYKFYHSLTAQGYNVLKFYEFPDHHPYSKEDIEKMCNENPKTFLMTTEKDWLRIPVVYQKKINYFPIELIFNDEDELSKFLFTKLRKNKY